MEKTYEYINDNGDKILLDIISIFTIDGYDGKYALASSSDDEIYSYQVLENGNKDSFVEIEDQNVIAIIQEMIDTLMR